MPEQQFSPAAQSLLAVHAVLAPHWFACPPPPQVSDPGQVPQSSMPPQPSGSDPQVAPATAQVVGAHVVPLLLDAVPELLEVVPELLLELLLELGACAHAPPAQVSAAGQSVLELHVSPQTFVDAQESPEGQSEFCAHEMGCWSVPMGTLPFEQAANAAAAITAPSGNRVFQSKAGRAFMGISRPPGCAGGTQPRWVSSPSWPASPPGVKKSSGLSGADYDAGWAFTPPSSSKPLAARAANPSASCLASS